MSAPTTATPPPTEVRAVAPPMLPRLAYVDTIKVSLIAGIIAAHGFIGYADFGSWAYQEVREVSLSATAKAFVTPFVSIFALFLMGLFFLISGLLTPASLDRKGTRAFVRDRLLRLGVPFAAYTLLLWPLLIYAVREPFLHRGSYWWWFTHEEPILDNGPLWFVGVLLIYSLGYAIWRAWRPSNSRSRHILLEGGVSGLMLIGLAAAIAVLTFLVRLQFPVDTGQIVNLHLWQWPQYIGLFTLGVMSARRGWLTPVPARLAKPCGRVALVAALALPTLIFTAEPLGQTEEAYYGGLGWPALAVAVVEGALAVTACIWVLAYAQRHWVRPPRPWLARSAYAAFILQGPVLVGLAMSLRPVPFPGDLKALLVAGMGVAVSYLVARILVTHTRLRRIL